MSDTLRLRVARFRGLDQRGDGIGNGLSTAWHCENALTTQGFLRPMAPCTLLSGDTPDPITTLCALHRRYHTAGINSTRGSDGASDGADAAGNGNGVGGRGQGTTTREFGEATGDLYAGGGGGYSPSGVARSSGGAGGGGRGGVGNANSGYTPGENGQPNTGGGGGGRSGDGTGRGLGGSGIVIIRNARGQAQ